MCDCYSHTPIQLAVNPSIYFWILFCWFHDKFNYQIAIVKKQIKTEDSNMKAHETLQGFYIIGSL